LITQITVTVDVYVFDVINKALEHTVTNQNTVWLLLLDKKKQLTCLLKMEIEPF